MTDKDNIEYWLNEVHQGDAREKLKEMPEESVDMVVTSPPYFGLRDYGKDDQMGLEESPYEFIQNLVDVGDEIYRVLKPTGSFYLNLGDTYAGGGGISGVPDDWDSASTQDREKYPDSVPARDVEFPDKCKMLIPHRTAISLMDNGWICRNDIVWSKPNPMPESVTDRRSTKFEYTFHFVKQQDYYYDLDSIREPYSDVSKKRAEYGFEGSNRTTEEYGAGNERDFNPDDIASNPNGKNPGDIQEVTTANHSEAHFAVFPQDLIEPHIKSSCPEKICKKCRKPYERIVESEPNPEGILGKKEPNSKTQSGGHDPEEIEGTRLKEGHNPTQYRSAEFKGWESTCDCDTEEVESGVVLDPFIGSGTTAVVAEKLGRDWIGIDLNKDYVEMSYDRIDDETKRIFDERSVFDY
jgi:DNA modification methylase